MNDLIDLSYAGDPFSSNIEKFPVWLKSFQITEFYSLRPQFLIVSIVILTSALIIKIAKNSDNGFENLVRPIIQMFIITLVIASSPFWMQLAWGGFVQIARVALNWKENQIIVTLISGLAGFFAGAIPENIDSLSKPTGTSMVTSLFKGLSYALTNCAMIVQTMLFILQYVMLQVCHLIAPIALALYAFDSTKDIAHKFVLQTLSIMSWLVGFAIVNLVAKKMALFLLPELIVGTAAAFVSDILGWDIIPSNKPVALYATIISSIIIGGSAMVPIFMQSLFTSGMAAAGQAFHPSMAGINGINVAKGQAGGQGMMPGPGGSMLPVPNSGRGGVSGGGTSANRPNPSVAAAEQVSTSSGNNLSTAAVRSGGGGGYSSNAASAARLANGSNVAMSTGNPDNDAAFAASTTSGTYSSSNPNSPINQAALNPTPIPAGAGAAATG